MMKWAIIGFISRYQLLKANSFNNNFGGVLDGLFCPINYVF